MTPGQSGAVSSKQAGVQRPGLLAAGPSSDSSTGTTGALSFQARWALQWASLQGGADTPETGETSAGLRSALAERPDDPSAATVVPAPGSFLGGNLASREEYQQAGVADASISPGIEGQARARSQVSPQLPTHVLNLRPAAVPASKSPQSSRQGSVADHKPQKSNDSKRASVLSKQGSQSTSVTQNLLSLNAAGTAAGSSLVLPLQTDPSHAPPAPMDRDAAGSNLRGADGFEASAASPYAYVIGPIGAAINAPGAEAGTGRGYPQNGASIGDSSSSGPAGEAQNEVEDHGTGSLATEAASAAGSSETGVQGEGSTHSAGPAVQPAEVQPVEAQAANRTGAAELKTSAVVPQWASNSGVSQEDNSAEVQPGADNQQAALRAPSIATPQDSLQPVQEQNRSRAQSGSWSLKNTEAQDSLDPLHRGSQPGGAQPGGSQLAGAQPETAQQTASAQAESSRHDWDRAAVSASARLEEKPAPGTLRGQPIAGSLDSGSHHLHMPDSLPAADAFSLARDPGGAQKTSATHAEMASNSKTAADGSTTFQNPGQTFTALDAETRAATPGWMHAGAQRAEAGYQDSELGWIGVRADASGGGVHATLLPGSAEAAQSLGGHLAGLNAFLAEQRTPVDSLTLAMPESREGRSGVGQGAGQGTNQGTNQDLNQGAGQQAPSGGSADSAFSTRPAVPEFAGSPEGFARAAGIGPAASIPVRDGSHISVMA